MIYEIACILFLTMITFHLRHDQTRCQTLQIAYYWPEGDHYTATKMNLCTMCQMFVPCFQIITCELSRLSDQEAQVIYSKRQGHEHLKGGRL